MKQALLGKLRAQEFFRRHWQKRPLFVRRGMPGFAGVLGLRALAALARRDDVESRIVEWRGGRRVTAHGPFSGEITLRRNATLLVSGVNLHLPAADRLLRRFDFLPQARLDDVMVSYARRGGGVGPHADSYDVFLLQGPGSRRWTIRPPRGGKKEIFVTTAGDLLYLPPGWRHDGVALRPCFTYSIGFRAPRAAELAAAFLDWLHERGFADSTYRDPGLQPTTRPGRIPKEMLFFARKNLQRIRWKSSDVEEFLGRYLTTPKPHVVFRAARATGNWIRLDPKTQLLYSGARFFINGEAFSPPARDRAALRALADRRELAAARLARQSRLVGEWRRAGYLRMEKRDG